jgi:hypothetical protein
VKIGAGGCRYPAPSGAGFEPRRPPVKFGNNMAAVDVAESPRWGLLLQVTSYPEAGRGDLRRNSYFENDISAVPICNNLT